MTRANSFLPGAARHCRRGGMCRSGIQSGQAQVFAWILLRMEMPHRRCVANRASPRSWWRSRIYSSGSMKYQIWIHAGVRRTETFGMQRAASCGSDGLSPVRPVGAGPLAAAPSLRAEANPAGLSPRGRSISMQICAFGSGAKARRMGQALQRREAAPNPRRDTQRHS